MMQMEAGAVGINEYLKKQMSKVFSSEDIIHDLENIQAHLINAANSRININDQTMSALKTQYNNNNSNSNNYSNTNVNRSVILGPVWDSDHQELHANCDTSGYTNDQIMKINEKSRTLHLGPELQKNNIIDAEIKLGRNKVQPSYNYSKTPAAAFSTKLDGFERRGQAWFLATELQSDIIVDVGDISFHLHKFPLISRSGRLNRLVFESRDTETDKIHLAEMPGGPEAFQLACKFCYGISVEMTAENVAALRCAAEYLEMTEDLGENNLVAKAEAYINMVVLASWKDSIAVLQSCQKLQPWGERVGIVKKCSESIAWKACMHQDHDQIHKIQGNGPAAQKQNSAGNNRKLANHGRKLDANINAVNEDAKKRLAEHSDEDWWIDNVVVGLSCVEYFAKVVKAIKSKGMKTELIGSSIVKYAVKWIFCAAESNKNPNQELGFANKANTEMGYANKVNTELGFAKNANSELDYSDKVNAELGYANNVREIVESLQDLICTCYFDTKPVISTNSVDNPLISANHVKSQDSDGDEYVNGNSIVSCAFLLKLLRVACHVGAREACRVQLERRAAAQLHQLRHSDLDLLLLFNDVALVQRLVDRFLQLHSVNMVDISAKSDAIQHRNKRINVACVLVAYLAEIGRDTQLLFQEFYGLMKSLQSAAADVACHDGLYRAIDAFLKGHANSTEDERTRLCQLMDCRKLSYQACMHAVHNDRLPLRVALQVLFFQLRPPPTANNDLTPTGRDNAFNTKGAAGGVYSLSGGKLGPGSANDGGNHGSGVYDGHLGPESNVDMLRMEVETLKSKYAQLEADYTRLQGLNNNNHTSAMSTSSTEAATRRPPSGSTSASPSWGSSLKKLGHLLHHRLSISADSANHHFNNNNNNQNANNPSVHPAIKQPPRSRLRNSIS